MHKIAFFRVGPCLPPASALIAQGKSAGVLPAASKWMHYNIMHSPDCCLWHHRHTYGRAENSSVSWLEHRKRSSLQSRCHPLRFRLMKLLRQKRSRAWQRKAVMCRQTLLPWSCSSSRSVPCYATCCPFPSTLVLCSTQCCCRCIMHKSTCSSLLQTLTERYNSLSHVNNMQMGEDDERPNGQASQPEDPDIDADTVALELWRTVSISWASSWCMSPGCLLLFLR